MFAGVWAGMWAGMWLQQTVRAWIAMPLWRGSDYCGGGNRPSMPGKLKGTGLPYVSNQTNASTNRFASIDTQKHQPAKALARASSSG